MFYSPLRYPGGKSRLAPFIAQLCVKNGISGHYIEPYSGGASVALFLVMNDYVERITINDKDRSLYAFWYSRSEERRVGKELRCLNVDEYVWENIAYAYVVG